MSGQQVVDPDCFNSHGGIIFLSFFFSFFCFCKRISLLLVLVSYVVKPLNDPGHVLARGFLVITGQIQEVAMASPEILKKKKKILIFNNNIYNFLHMASQKFSEPICKFL